MKENIVFPVVLSGLCACGVVWLVKLLGLQDLSVAQNLINTIHQHGASAKISLFFFFWVVLLLTISGWRSGLGKKIRIVIAAGVCLVIGAILVLLAPVLIESLISLLPD